jgi:hypothetical protein
LDENQLLRRTGYERLAQNPVDRHVRPGEGYALTRNDGQRTSVLAGDLKTADAEDCDAVPCNA